MGTVLSMIGTLKAVISLFKYAPQVTVHRQQRSADEWHTATILLDLCGNHQTKGLITFIDCFL